jgi:hypothetical protein
MKSGTPADARMMRYTWVLVHNTPGLSTSKIRFLFFVLIFNNHQTILTLNLRTPLHS